MSCETWRPLIMEAAEKGLDALDRAARNRLTSHLTQCVECQAALEDQQAVRDVLNARVDAPVPTGFALRVLAGMTAGPSVNPERAWVELFRWRNLVVSPSPVGRRPAALRCDDRPKHGGGNTRRTLRVGRVVGL